MSHAIIGALICCLSIPVYASTYDTALTVMREVKSENRYVFYAARDFEPMVKGERGNCARFAATYADRMKGEGVESGVLTLNVKDVGPHSVAVTFDGWVLDVLREEPVRVEELFRE